MMPSQSLEVTWTEEMTIGLVSAIEALQIKEGGETLAILRRFRKVITVERIKIVYEIHVDKLTFQFDPKKPKVTSLKVLVEIFCEGRCDFGHNWSQRIVKIIEPDERQPTDLSFVYLGKMNAPLDFVLE